jgi:hypothetical protein
MLYISRAVGPQTTAVTGSILSAAQAYNQLHGISGVLCQGQGLYLQVLEGERSAVNQLYGLIIHDPRHKDVELLQIEEIVERRFAKWSMAFVDISDRDPMIMMGHPEFDPYSASGALVMTMIGELVAAGHDIKLPVV